MLPSQNEMEIPLLKALIALGGKASPREEYCKILQNIRFSPHTN